MSLWFQELTLLTNRLYAPPGEYSESSAPSVSVAILNTVKQELDKHETELKTQSTFAHLRDTIVGENSNWLTCIKYKEFSKWIII